VTRRIWALWTFLALAFTAILWLVTIRRPFGLELHAWASAHMSVMARSFADQGVFHLHGVPIQNNSPLGTQPDRYIHWPPLFAILLSVAFRILGDSAFTAHVFVLFLNLIYLAVFFKLAKHCFGRQVAVLSLFGAVTLPIFFQYSALVWTVNAGLIGIMLALYCFVRATENELNWKWVWAGMAAVAAGTLLSWEPILLGFVLLAIALLLKSKPGIRAAIAYVASGIGTTALILLVYVTASPELRADLWSTIAVRLGGSYNSSAVPIHAIFDRMWYADHEWDRWTLFARSQFLIGPVALLAIAGLLLWTWEKRKEMKAPYFVLGGLLGVWLGWFAIFPNHVYVHDYQWLLAVPLAGIAIGVGLNAVTTRLQGSLKWLSLAVLPALLLVPLAAETSHAFDARNAHSPMIDYANEIRENTPDSAVILSVSPSMVPVYYSNRHTLRYVDEEQTLRLMNREVWQVFPGSDVYLALTPVYAIRFPCALANFPTVKRTPNLILLKMSPDTCN
jgi:4-amino-4-deoxy-L-arabinose transferase-like glycosyltransferase